MATLGNSDTRDMANPEMDMADPEKANTHEIENGNSGSSNDGIEGGINHHSWDNHTSFNKYPTHQEGYENKVCLFGFRPKAPILTIRFTD